MFSGGGDHCRWVGLYLSKAVRQQIWVKVKRKDVVSCRKFKGMNGHGFCIIDESGGKEKAYYYVTFAHIKITTFYK